MSDQEALFRGFQAAVKSAIEASVTPQYLVEKRVKYLGLPFSVPDDQKYLEIAHIDSGPAWEAWGDETLQQGAFRLILHWPLLAPYEPSRVLASIVSYFQKDRRFSGFKVSAVPSFGGVLEQGKENLYPATVRYQRST